MRLTIARLRTLVLTAGILLLLALVAFLALGKWKNFFIRRDLPQRLGMEIQQEANGVTYTQARGGHTLFKIHASRVVQLRKGNALLHDVWIDLYSADGKSVDRIAGSEFEYDQKAGKAVAAGAVEITLMRPGEAPAIASTIASTIAAPPLSSIASKAASGQSVARTSGGKSTPLSAAAKAAAEGQIHVETSGLTFDQKSGVATTSQPVQFSLAQGSGSSIGATFDSQQGQLVLDQAVELTTRRGAQTVHVHAHHAEFERTSQICRLSAATAETSSGDATASQATLLFRADGSLVQLNAANGFTLTTARGSRLTAPSGELQFDAHNRPRQGRLTGGVTMDSASATGSSSRQLHETAPVANLEFTALGQLRSMHMEQGVTMDSRESDGPRQMSRRWRSPIADIAFRDSGLRSKAGQIEPATIHGAGGVIVTSESQRGHQAPTNSRLSADEVTGTFSSGSGSSAVLTALTGVGHARLEETTPSGTQQTIDGDRLEVHFAAPATAGINTSAKPATKGAGQIQSATVEGHVLLTEQSPSKPGSPAPAPLRATANHAVYAAAGQWLRLTGSPRVEDGALQLTADTVDVSQTTGQAFAHGNVKASWISSSATSSNQPNGSSRPNRSAASLGQGAPSLGGPNLGGQGLNEQGLNEQSPAHIVAAEAALNRATGLATFSGQARLWQGANSVSAPLIILDRNRQTLVARTRNAAQPVRVVLVSGDGQRAAQAANSGAGKPAPHAVIEVSGGDLTYSNLTRTALMRGGVLGTVLARTATASTRAREVAVQLTPASKNSQPDPRGNQRQSQNQAPNQSQLQTLTARGHVLLTSEGRRATGEQLVYTSATGEYVLTGTAIAPPRLTDPTRGSVTGTALIFHGGNDSVRVEGDAHKTRTETTAPK